MNTTNERNARLVVACTYTGLGAGFLAFLGLGALPGLVYGGYMGVIMAGAIFGTPVESSLLTRLTVGGGMALGGLTAMSFFLVLGSVLGSLAGLAIAGIRGAPETPPFEGKDLEIH